jgi:transcriptional regulator GlxA family with amidase domain
MAVPRPGSRPIVEALLRLCVLYLLRRQHELGRLPDWMFLPAPGAGFEALLVQMMEQPEAEYTIAQLAEIAGVSRARLLRTFAQTFGQSPGELLRDLRLNRAAALLSSSRRPVASIASQVGYESRSHFSRLFKDRFGVDPTTYRRDV